LRLAAFVAAIVLAALGYRDHFLVGMLPWWRWVVEILAAAALLVLALPFAGGDGEGRVRRLGRWICTIASVAAWLAAVDLVPQRGRELEAAIAVMAGIVLAGVARWVPFSSVTAALVLAPAFPGRGGLGRGLIVMAAGVGASLGAVRVNDQDPFLGFALWLAGIAVFAAGVHVAGSRRPPEAPATWSHEAGPQLPRSIEGVLFVIVLAVGAGFRLFALGDVPTWIDADEGRLAHWGLGIWKEGFPNAFAFGWNSFPHLAYMLHVTGVQLLGYANVHLRLVSALIGIFTLVPVFFFVRRWWGGAVALLAMALLAVNQEHVYWSRVGFNNIDAVLVASLVLAAYARALHSARPIDWVWVGLALGAGYHTYHAAKFYPVLLAVAFVLIALGARRTLAAHGRGLLAAGVVFVLTLGPQFVSLQRQWTTFRIDTSNRNNVHVAFEAYAAGNVSGLRDHVYRQVVDCIYAFISIPHNLSILDAATSVPFLAGVLWLFWRWRDPRHVLVLVWIAGILVAGGMMTDFPPSKQRMVGFLPLVCLVPAIVAGRARGLVHAFLGGRGDAVFFILAVGWLSFAAWGNWWTHFVYQADRMRGDVMTSVCRRLLAAERPFTVYTIGATSTTNPHMLERDCTLGPDEQRIVVNPAADHAVVPLPPGHRGGAIFSVASEQREIVSWIRNFYPAAKFEIIRGASGSEDAFFVTLERPDVERTRGLALQYRDASGVWRLGETAPPYPQPDFVYRLRAPADAAPGSRALWRGQVWVPEGGTWRFRIDQGHIRIGATAADGGEVLLVQGWHGIEVDLPVGNDGEGAILAWRAPGAGDWAPVPRENLFDRPAASFLLGRYFIGEIGAAGAAPIGRPAAHERLEGALAFEWRLYDDGEMPPWFAAQPSTMEWSGRVDLGAGDAAIRVEASAPVQVFVDGALRVDLDATQGQQSTEIGLSDTRGMVPFLVRARRPAQDNPEYWQLRVLWRTPGGDWSALGPYVPALSPLTPAPSDPVGPAGGLPGS
jgi:4-amino-4-deoxy-L-arabinose transferase-like glycosyltransferase